MKLFHVFAVLLVFLCLHCVSKANETQFKVRINERGSRFNEEIRIDEKRNIVSFMVPKHNDVDRSEVRNDFNLKLTITRLPDVGICHIKPLEKRLPSPRKLKSEMSLIKNANMRIQQQSTMVSSSEWTFDKRLNEKDLPPTVVRFCAGLPIYRLKKRSKDWVVMQGNDTTSRKKRQATSFTFCPNWNSNMKCDPDEWRINCKFVVGTTCVYWVACQTPIRKLNRDLRNCKFSHDFSAVMCCLPTCPTK